MIKIVYGAPFSGKTTFVKNKVEKNDLVYDFDALMQSLTFAEYQDTNSNLIDLNKDIRDLIIKQSQNDDINNTYIITTFIDNKLKDKLRDLKVKKIKMETEKEVCLSRLKNSSRKNKKEIKEVIDKWFDYYHEDERGELMENKEVRHFQLDDIEIRKDEDNKIESFEGYVVKYDTRSHFLGFYETVDKRAFDNTLQSNNNIFALYNHDWDKPLASTHNKSLELSTDDTGLKFKLTPKANTSFMNDVRELVNSGELRGCSFGFRVKDDEWTTKDGYDYRTLKDVDVVEITLTHRPAYESSEVSIRSYEDYKAEKEQQEQRKQELELLKLQRDVMMMRNK